MRGEERDQQPKKLILSIEQKLNLSSNSSISLSFFYMVWFVADDEKETKERASNFKLI